MFDLLDRLNALELRVLDDDLLLKRAVLRDVDVLVDRRGDEKTAVFAIVRRQIGATAAERNTQRRTGNDHEKREKPFRLLHVVAAVPINFFDNIERCNPLRKAGSRIPFKTDIFNESIIFEGPG